jgi:hypothetical protein
MITPIKKTETFYRRLQKCPLSRIARASNLKPNKLSYNILTKLSEELANPVDVYFNSDRLLVD